MQLFKLIWVFVVELADYPARLGSQLSSGFSFQSPSSALKDQYNLHPAGTPCVHSPDRRDCWYGGNSIHTDYEKHVPETGVTNYVCGQAPLSSKVANCTSTLWSSPMLHGKEMGSNSRAC